MNNSFKIYLIIIISITFLTTCNNDDSLKEDNTGINVYFKNVVGKLQKSDSTGEWEFFQIPELGNSVENGLDSVLRYTVLNWDKEYDNYDNYDKGCLISGKRKGNDIIISDIKRYFLLEDEKTRSTNNDFSCEIFNDPGGSSYIPIKSFYDFFCVKIYLHIVRTSYGVGLDKDTVQENVMSQLNGFYNGTGVSFICIGSGYIDDNAFNSLNYKNYGILSNINSHPDAIDIYIQSNGEALGKTCMAYSIPSTSLISNSSNYNKNNTIAHAIGHCLGLYHTYYGTKGGNGTPELVDGSNSSKAGDYCIDTPADPGEWNSLMECKDSNNMQYIPDIENFMNNYPDRSLSNKISQGQLSRINHLLKSNQQLENICTQQFPYKMTGSSWIGLNGNYLVDFPENYVVKWEISCRTYLNKSETQVSSLSFQGHLWNVPDSLASGNSKRIFLNAYGKSSRGFRFLLTKNVRYLNICPETSSIKYTIYNNSSVRENGLIRINDNNQVVKVHRGEDIRFEFYDLCDVSNSDIDMTYWNNNFLKIPTTRFTFNCLKTASLGYQKYPLNISYDNKTKMIPITVDIME